MEYNQEVETTHTVVLNDHEWNTLIGILRTYRKDIYDKLPQAAGMSTAQLELLEEFGVFQGNPLARHGGVVEIDPARNTSDFGLAYHKRPSDDRIPGRDG